MVEISFAKPTVKQNRIFGEILHIDNFGNIITNISRRFLENLNLVEGIFFEVRVGKLSKEIRFCKTYEGVPINTPLIIIGSSGFLEISLNQGSAKSFFMTAVGSKVEFSFLS
jgi:S-adenosylmethionine hydrolase